MVPQPHTPQPHTPPPCTISPARGQALLSFEDRRMPEHMPLFETVKVVPFVTD